MSTMRTRLTVLLCAAQLSAYASAQGIRLGNNPKVMLTFPGASAPALLTEDHGRTTLRGLYTGIDAVFYYNRGVAEYDFILSPRAESSLIRIAFEGADSTRLTKTGDIEVIAGSLIIEHKRPFAYQESNGVRKQISCRYRLGLDRTVRVEVGDCDRNSVLIIDPVLTNVLTLGGNYVTGITGVTTDANGYTYLVGTTSWPNFPTSAGPLSHFNGSSGSSALAGDVFVVKLAPATNSVVWSVLVGGSADEISTGLGIDAQGNVFVGGSTDSSNFPITSPPANGHIPSPSNFDLFVFELNPQGTALIYSTLIGGTGEDVANSLALAADGHVALVGSTNSQDFPTTSGAVQGAIGSATEDDAVVVRLNSAGVINYASYLGGTGNDYATDVAFDSGGDMYITGVAGAFFPTLATAFAPHAEYGGFVTRLDNATGQLVYSTYIPGVSLDDIAVYPRLLIQVDGSQNAYVAGPAEYVFPTTPGAFQTDSNNQDRSAFVLELNPAGTSLVFSTLIGGDSDDLAMGLALTGNSVTIVGITNSSDFPVNDYSMPACNVNAIPSEYFVIFSTFVASFDHSGRLLTSSEYSNCDDERVAAIAPTSQGILMAWTI